MVYIIAGEGPSTQKEHEAFSFNFYGVFLVDFSLHELELFIGKY